MIKYYLVGVIVGSLMAGSVGMTQAMPVLDQSHLSSVDTTGAVTSDFSWQQGVTAGITGHLTGLEIFLTDDDGSQSPENIIAEIYVSGVLLGSDTLLYNDVGTSSLNFDFSADSIMMSAGTMFEFWISGSDSTYNYAFDIVTDGVYAGGILKNTLGESFSNWDLRFNTFVDKKSNPVPEPATMILFGTGLTALIGAKFTKKG